MLDERETNSEKVSDRGSEMARHDFMPEDAMSEQV